MASLATLETKVADLVKFAEAAVTAYETQSDTIKLPNGVIIIKNTGGTLHERRTLAWGVRERALDSKRRQAS